MDTIPAEFIIPQDDGFFKIKAEWWTTPAVEGAPFCYPKQPHPNDVVDLFVLQHENTMKAFGDSYPVPFLNKTTTGNARNNHEWGDVPRPIVELRMCALSAAIRDKTNWQEKMRNPEIVSKWTQEALDQKDSGDFLPEQALTEEMVHYVIGELEGYSRLKDGQTGIEVACYERVWKSDSLVSSDLLAKLLECVSILEDGPDREKDWHPGSNGQVLDLVHPSLYPLVYGSTLEKNENGELVVIDFASRTPLYDSNFRSEDYAWIPSDFVVSADGHCKLNPGTYINNLHPDDDAALYPIIEDILSLALPMFEHVLSDLKRPLSKFRIETEPEWTLLGYDFISAHNIPCIWEQDGYSAGPPDPPDGMSDEEGYAAYQQSLPKRLPKPLPQYDGALDRIEKTVSLAGSTIQVICKMANIILTPENPSYPGGSWHVEGMMNEEIVSTFIYYYDEVNTTESRLAFRTSVIEPRYHGQDDDACTHVIYGLERDSPLVQDIGSVRTCKGRCIAFPNIYQHQVQPFKLKDDTKPGHRKILAFFLINPDKRIPSTTTIPPQQHEWLARAARSALVRFLPSELVEVIIEHLKSFTTTRAETEEVRVKLMKERSQSVVKLDSQKFQVSFNMCEH